jgi:hypothetical protein
VASITRFYALVLSTVLLLSGVPGFFPNIVSFQPLITFFALTLVHSVVHAAVGLLGLLITALASDDSVRIYTVGIALLYGILAAVGIAGVNFAPVLYFNAADNVLHGAIFALSLGIALAGVAEERSRRRKERFMDGLPDSHWAVPSGPGQISGAPMSRAAMMGSVGGAMADGGQMSWQNQPAREQMPQNVWSQNPWPQYQQAPSQPASQPSGQPSAQPRDPWTREQRRPVDQYPTGAPSQTPQPQAPQSPWSQAPQPPSQQPPSQPWQGPSSRSPWPPNSQPREQWPLDEWPSLNNPRSSQRHD